MERPGLLLVIGLLAVALPAAAATFGAQPGAPCEPTLLATQVSLFCAPDMPTAQCCKPVVAAVDLGGGVPCLCRVAAEPRLVISGLNATHLLTLYTSCGGLRPGGAHLVAACEDHIPLDAAVVSAPPLTAPRYKQPARDAHPPVAGQKPVWLPQQHGKAIPTDAATSPLPSAARGKSLECRHNPAVLASDLVTWCTEPPTSPNAECCSFVQATINDGCICEVAEQPELNESILDRSHLIYLFKKCGGTRPPHGGECSRAPPPDQSHPPSASQPAKPGKGNRSGTWIVALVIVGLFLLAVVGYCLYLAWQDYSSKSAQSAQETVQESRQERSERHYQAVAARAEANAAPSEAASVAR